MRRPGHPLSRTQGERDGVRGVSINHLVVGQFYCSLHAPREDFLTRSVRTTFKLTRYRRLCKLAKLSLESDHRWFPCIGSLFCGCKGKFHTLPLYSNSSMADPHCA